MKFCTYDIPGLMSKIILVFITQNGCVIIVENKLAYILANVTDFIN